MSIFETYVTLGFHHILTLDAYDHILFIIALCVVYPLEQWRRVTVLVTAFTVGHSVTLALATLGLVYIPSRIIEFLIPVTIFLTSLMNVLNNVKAKSSGTILGSYFMALFFGLIHGMGFSNYLRLLLGKEQGLVLPLFSFNLGLEGGQLIVVILVLALSQIFITNFNILHRKWTVSISSLTAFSALLLIFQTKIW